MSLAAAAGWLRIQARVRDHKAQLRLCLRVTAAAVLSYLVLQPLDVPLHGLWAVLTAILVSQMSVGGSIKATTEYVVGTLCGAIYAGAVAILVPHTSTAAVAAALALSIAPLALAAAVSPTFRAAPFTAILVLLLSTQLLEGPLMAAIYRVIEVAIGGACAVIVSLVVWPDRAEGLSIEAAARVLDRMAGALPEILAGCTRRADATAFQQIQDEVGEAVAQLQTIAVEARREQLISLGTWADPARLARTVLRLRHDLVMLGRAAVEPLPDLFAARLGSLLARIGVSAGDHLRASAAALLARRQPPPADDVTAALDAYAAAFAALRREGATRDLTGGAVERLFALGFALDQLRRNFADLEDAISHFARGGRRTSRSSP
jgi:uncharacterized membrane protein YccC